jgi:diguanylate cyclase (GGDEF)-like protein
MTDSPEDGVDQFVRAWAKTIARTSYVRMTRAESDEFLRGLVHRLDVALRAEPFSSIPGTEIGLDLVKNDYAAPEALGRTVEVIHNRLLADLGLPGEQPHRRLGNLLEALGTAYARAVRDRTLDEQDAIRKAAMLAREQTEQALRAAESRFWHARAHDPLTGLPNRALFNDRLSDLLGASQPDARVGVCAVDLDRFQAVNDSLGHAAGDALLVAVSERLSDLVGELGFELGHFGADEFVVLVHDTRSADDAVAVAREILAALAAPFDFAGRSVRVTASIGVVERPVAGTDPTELIRAAAMTLHWAKADGGGRWAVFDDDRSAHERERYDLAAAIPGGLERDEFLVHYQPLVDLADGTVRGVEALARWRHPELGLLTADRFIELVEDSGLIELLGVRLLEQSCREAASWPGPAITAPYVSVNLAVRQIRDPDLVAAVADVLERTGLPPHRLQLEITESALMDNGDQTIGVLKALGDLGVRLAIDDFGTGYSNLAYLRTLPVHAIKLAGAFIEGLGAPEPADPTDEAIVSTLVNLGHTLGLAVTAEGVETAEQAERLREIDCDTAQGWHFGHPVPPELLGHVLAPRLPGARAPEGVRLQR